MNLAVQVCANPLLNVVAVPEESNVFVWHANVRSGQDSVLEAAAIHLIIHFAENYPMQPPKVSHFIPPIPARICAPNQPFVPK